jgi:hypothetical protein
MASVFTSMLTVYDSLGPGPSEFFNDYYTRRVTLDGYNNLLGVPYVAFLYFQTNLDGDVVDITSDLIEPTFHSYGIIFIKNVAGPYNSQANGTIYSSAVTTFLLGGTPGTLAKVEGVLDGDTTIKFDTTDFYPSDVPYPTGGGMFFDNSIFFDTCQPDCQDFGYCYAFTQVPYTLDDVEIFINFSLVINYITCVGMAVRFQLTTNRPDDQFGDAILKIMGEQPATFSYLTTKLMISRLPPP